MRVSERIKVAAASALYCYCGPPVDRGLREAHQSHVEVVRPGNVPAEPDGGRGGGCDSAAPLRTLSPLVVHVTHDELREPFIDIYSDADPIGAW